MSQRKGETDLEWKVRRRELDRAYREKNRERIQAQKRAYREKNRERIQAQKRAYHEENLELCREQSRERNRRYYEQHHEKLRAYGKAWRDARPGYGAERRRIYDPHRVKANAQQQARRAFPEPQPCETCGSDERIQRHHEDYRKPLEIRWLCASCHQRDHGPERFA